MLSPSLLGERSGFVLPNGIDWGRSTTYVQGAAACEDAFRFRRSTRLPFGLVTLAIGAWLGAATLATFSADGLVQLLTVALVVAAAVPVMRNRAKDSTIEALRASAEARLERIHDLESDLAGCKQRADEEHKSRAEADRKVSKLEGKLEEQAKYTAPEAFEMISSHLAKIEELMRAWIVKDETRDLS